MKEQPNSSPQPCPFCGSDKIMCESHEPLKITMVCQKCLACGPYVDIQDKSNAIKAWNKRKTK